MFFWRNKESYFRLLHEKRAKMLLNYKIKKFMKYLQYIVYIPDNYTFFSRNTMINDDFLFSKKNYGLFSFSTVFRSLFSIKKMEYPKKFFFGSANLSLPNYQKPFLVFGLEFFYLAILVKKELIYSHI